MDEKEELLFWVRVDKTGNLFIDFKGSGLNLNAAVTAGLDEFFFMASKDDKKQFDNFKKAFMAGVNALTFEREE